jgi:hypothetical protein
MKKRKEVKCWVGWSPYEDGLMPETTRLRRKDCWDGIAESCWHVDGGQTALKARGYRVKRATLIIED